MANRSGVRYLILLVGIAATCAVLLIELGHTQPERLHITSSSMQPTLAVGQIVRLDTSAYASSRPQIGDIVAIRAPVGAIGDTPVCGVARPGRSVVPPRRRSGRVGRQPQLGPRADLIHHRQGRPLKSHRAG